MQTNEMLTQTFLTFAEKECKGSSFIYELLSKQIAMDKTLLNIAKCAREGQPVPNLLFGAVHYLLLKGTNHSLKDYYLVSQRIPKQLRLRFLFLKISASNIKRRLNGFSKRS